jgi:hypothetical protein
LNAPSRPSRWPPYGTKSKIGSTPQR